MIIKKYIHHFKSSLFLRDIAITFSNKLVILFIGLFTSIAIARYLGPEGRGLYATASVLLGLAVQFGNLGLHSTNVHYSALDTNNKDILFGNSLFFGLGVGILVATIIGIASAIDPLIIPINGVLLYLTLVSIPISLSYLLLQNLILGLNFIQVFNKIELLSKVVATTLIVFLLFIDLRSPESMMLAICISSIFALSGVYNFLRSRSTPVVSLIFFFKNFSYGLKAYLAALFSFIQQKIILYYITLYCGNTEAGFFSIAQTIFDLSLIFPVTVASILFPKLSSNNSKLGKWQMTKKVLLMIAGIMIVYIFILFFSSSFIIESLYGSSFNSSNDMLKYLLPGLFFLSIISVVMNFLASSGMPFIVIITPLLSCVIIFFSAFIFKDVFDGSKAALINSFSNLIAFIIIIIYFIKKKPVNNER